MGHIVSILLAYTGEAKTTELFVLTLDIFCGLSGRLDLSGMRRITANALFLEDCATRGGVAPVAAHNAKVWRPKTDSSHHTHNQYMATISYVLPWISTALRYSCQRHVTLRVIELIIKLVMLHENAVFFIHAPKCVYESLVSLLYVTGTFTELTFESDNIITTRSRPPASVAGGYMDTFDTEIRENMLDTLSAMFAASPKIQARLCEVGAFIPIISKLFRMRRDGRAENMLATLAKRPEYKKVFEAQSLDWMLAAMSGDELAAEMILVTAEPLLSGKLDPQPVAPVSVPTSAGAGISHGFVPHVGSFGALSEM
jgi:hypothetical protein